MAAKPDNWVKIPNDMTKTHREAAPRAPLTPSSTAEFIECIRREISTGGGLIPFIGSGCSSASGIMMGQQFDEYLAYTVYLCVAAPPFQEKRWNLREQGWPSQPEISEIDKARSWVEEQYDSIFPQEKGKAVQFRLPHLLNRPSIPRILGDRNYWKKNSELRELHRVFGSSGAKRGGFCRSGISPTSEEAITERAIRSLYDWRATLSFLSELELVRDNVLLMAEPDCTLVDRFNVHITTGRKPNLLHTMLCHLAGPARIRTILTTNFDQLIESAFASQNQNISVIPVGLKGELPDQDIVRSRNTVVKLHGDFSETRADFSLDESPTVQSKRRFFHYVEGRFPEAEPTTGFLPATLLVCGYSGQDNRCVELIKYILDSNRDARVYWICHTTADQETINGVFDEREYRVPQRLISVVTDRTDLLLYELYQHLTLCLPPGGFTYQYSHNVPPHIGRDGNARELADELFKATKKRFPDPEPNYLQLALGGVKPGVLALLRHYLQRIIKARPAYSYIWLELEDYADTNCVAHELLQIISIRRGLFQRSHGDLVPAAVIEQLLAEIPGETRAMRIARRSEIWRNYLRLIITTYLQIKQEDWIIILYGRNGAGGCSGWEEETFWSDENNGEFGESGAFASFVRALCEVGFRVVYAPYSIERSAQDKEHFPTRIQPYCHERELDVDFKKGLDFAGWRNLLRPIAGMKIAPKRKARPISFKTTKEHIANDWITKGKSDSSDDFVKRCLFLYNVTLFRQSRHYSAFVSEGIQRCPERFNVRGYDNDWMRKDSLHKANLSGYLDKLKRGGFLFEKPGGFAWTYRDFRVSAQDEIVKIDSNLFNEHPKTWRAYAHLWIADWYMRAYYNSGHACPLIEALYHFRQCAKHADKFRADSNKSESELFWKRYRIWRVAICEMTKALQLGRSDLKLWLAVPHYCGWLSAAALKEPFEQCFKSLIESYLKCGMTKSTAKKIAVHGEGLIQLLANEQMNVCGESAPLSGRRPSTVIKSLPIIQDVNLHLSEKSLDNEPVDLEKSEIWGHLSDAPKDVKALIRSVSRAWNKKVPIDEKQPLDTAVKEWRRLRLESDPSDEGLCRTIQDLNECAFSTLKAAKANQAILELSNSVPKLSDPNSASDFLCLDPVTREQWVMVTIFCGTVLHLCKSLNAAYTNLEIEERIKALSIYAVGLARLGRFYEAHRRLNEANALILKTSFQSSVVFLGILHLRRAEVHFLESLLTCEMLTHPTGKTYPTKEWRGLDPKHLAKRYELALDQNGKWKSEDKDLIDRVKHAKFSLAKLDDAWMCLEDAERLLGGRLHSSRWWSRLCILKLRCLAHRQFRKPKGTKEQIVYKSMVERWRRERYARIYDAFLDGMANALGDRTFQLQIAHYALWASRDCRNYFQKICSKLAEIIPELQGDLNNWESAHKLYGEEIRNRFLKLLPRKAVRVASKPADPKPRTF